MKTPHELPGTSRRACSGRTNPSPSGFDVSAVPGGTASWNGSWKSIAWSASAPNSIVGAGGDGIDLRAVGVGELVDARVGGIDQHGAGLHRHLLAAERLDHDDAQARQRDDDDVEDGDRRGHPRGRADLGAGDRGEALPPAPDRGGQHHHVLHRAGQADADDQPDQPRQVAELDRQDRPDQRPRPRDRREVVAEEDPAVRRVEVLAVVMPWAGVVRLSSSAATRAARKALVVSIRHGQDRQDPEHHRHRMDSHRGFDLPEARCRTIEPRVSAATPTNLRHGSWPSSDRRPGSGRSRGSRRPSGHAGKFGSGDLVL